MFVGVIKTKDVLMNPVSIIRMRGIKGFFKLLYRALSPKPYPFINMTQNTQWIRLDHKKH
ncbi:MAG: hypothetical protein HY073_02300 [Deltaproteobacteria bacterium]|nr:hypothetical protein [Deltaproteobacteria bacterium]